MNITIISKNMSDEEFDRLDDSSKVSRAEVEDILSTSAEDNARAWHFFCPPDLQEMLKEAFGSVSNITITSPHEITGRKYELISYDEMSHIKSVAEKGDRAKWTAPESGFPKGKGRGAVRKGSRRKGPGKRK